MKHATSQDIEGILRENAALREQKIELLTALEKMEWFISEWRDCLEGVQMTSAQFQQHSGLSEARAILAKAKGEPTP